MALPSAREIRGILPTWSLPHLSPRSHTSSAQPRVAQGRQDENKEPKSCGVGVLLPGQRSWHLPGFTQGELPLSSEQLSRSSQQYSITNIQFIISSEQHFRCFPKHSSPTQQCQGFLAVAASRPLCREGKAEPCPKSLITIPRNAQALDTSAAAAIY